MKKIRAKPRPMIPKSNSKPLINFDTSEVLTALPSFTDISIDNTSNSCITMELNQSYQKSSLNSSESMHTFETTNETVEFSRLNVTNLDIMLLQEDETYYQIGRVEQLNGRLKFYEQLILRLTGDCDRVCDKLRIK